MTGIYLLAAAVPQEIDMLIPMLGQVKPIGGRPAWEGKLGRREVLLVNTGMGMVNAAQAITAAVENNSSIGGVINFGCAGAYAGSGLSLGEVAAASSVVFADQGVAAKKHWNSLKKIGIPLETGPDGEAVYNELPVDQTLTADLARKDGPSGVFATVAQVSGDLQTAAELEERWGAIIEEMEGGAVSQVALHYGLPFAAVRGVSNMCGDTHLDIPAGCRSAQEAILDWGDR